ncbi:PHD finger protein 14-like isoform X2 [Atheta coriaria]|uniref:PHD finger protein 14-like isoform X2 n=1 Tax=Dalotia coriaria TaxID=877792 RepID=UPI0031F34C0D
MTTLERDPKKRRVKPVESSILDFDLGESSDDSDFRIEDHPDVSDDDSVDSNANNDSSSDVDDDDAEDSDASNFGKSLNLTANSNGFSIADIIEKAASQNVGFSEKDADILICCGCLGDQSDGVNEIAECDSCGVTVHEACYGISDSNSLASTDSEAPTTPWFCDACKAGVTKPVCELCPNSGGLFKETDVGKWVHLVCALYVPGVAFGEVDKLSSVTLFEMQYSKWGSKTCSLCVEDRFARTGVCIGCDAGMCRNYFHVTCAQREGFLSEAHTEEVDQADPFYAHCKLHSDKTLVKKRKRNYLAIQVRTHFRKLQFEAAGFTETPEQVRIQRKLQKKRMHYKALKLTRQQPWVPTQKMPRLLTTSASACKKLIRKAELMGIDTPSLEMQEAQMAALVDIRKKWHIPPAFSVEFVAYYLDRNERLKSMKDSLEHLLDNNKVLLGEQTELRAKYDQLLKESTDEQQTNANLKQTIHKFHSAILSCCSNTRLPNVEDLGKPPMPRPAPTPMMVPTAAALKMGVGFPLNNIPANRNESGKVLSSHAKQDPIQLNECGICRQRRDQHMLAKCDTCHLYYHLNCLNPPLTRLPKKSKLYGWQCSECDKTSDSEVEQVKQPRRSRGRHSRGSLDEVFTPIVKIKPVTPAPPLLVVPPLSTPISSTPPSPAHAQDPIAVEPLAPLPLPEPSETPVSPVTLTVRKYPSPTITPTLTPPHHNSFSPGIDTSADITSSFNNSTLDSTTSEVYPLVISKSSKKRRREKHRNRYSPELGGSTKEHKRKRKKKSLDIENPNPHPRITIKIKPIPLPAGEVASTSNPQCFYVNNESNYVPPMPMSSLLPVTPSVTPVTVTTTAIAASSCDVCKEDGSNANMVKCDECQKNYHFACLEPPLKKTPKKRGYSWHCADCDPTGSE